MKRSFEVFKLNLQMYPGRKMLYETTLKKELRQIIQFAFSSPIRDRKIVAEKDKQVYYIDDYITNDDITHVHMCSGKYNKQRFVFDVETDQEKGVLKKRKDAEREHNYISFIFLSENDCYCAYEHNHDGIGVSKFIYYLNHISEMYVKNLEDKSKFYKWQYSILVSKEFLSELEKLDRITMASIIVESEEISDNEFKSEKNRDVSDEIQLIYKPSSRGGSIGKSFMKKLKNLYDNNRVIRVTANGESNKSKIKLDTEEMKTKIEVDVKEDLLGLVQWEDMRKIFTEYFEKLKRGEIYEVRSTEDFQEETFKTEIV